MFRQIMCRPDWEFIKIWDTDNIHDSAVFFPVTSNSFGMWHYRAMDMTLKVQLLVLSFGNGIEYFPILYYDHQMYIYFQNYHTPTCFDKSCVGQTGSSLKYGIQTIFTILLFFPPSDIQLLRDVTLQSNGHDPEGTTTCPFFRKLSWIFSFLYYDKQMNIYLTNYHTPICFDKSCVGQTGRSVKIWDTDNIHDSAVFSSQWHPIASGCDIRGQWTWLWKYNKLSILSEIQF